MSAKGILLKAINLEKPARIPVTLLSGGAWTFNNRGYALADVLEKPELMAEIIVETNEKVRSDVVWAGSGYNNLPIRALGGKIKFRAKGAPDVQEDLLETASAVDKLDLNRLGEDEGVRGLWETTAMLDRAIGERTLVGASGWGPFSLAAQVFGVEKMMRGMFKDKAAVHAVLEFATELSFRYYEPFIKAGARILSVGEPTSSGDLLSRRHFIEFALPYQKKFMQRVKAIGALSLLHICGDITDRLDLIPDSGADVLSVDFKVDLAQAKAVVGTKIAIAGNVNPVSPLENGTPAEVAAAARDCIEKAGQDGNFILTPGCDIPPGVPPENIRAFIETGLRWYL